MENRKKKWKYILLWDKPTYIVLNIMACVCKVKTKNTPTNKQKTIIRTEEYKFITSNDVFSY